VVGIAAAEVVRAELAELAGCGLYRRNAFRVTGAATDASDPSVRQRRYDAIKARRVGGWLRTVSELPVLVSTGELAAAFDVLEDSPRRIVHELFWMWGDDAGCGCPAQLHADHDQAVRAHAQAVDLALLGTEPERAAASATAAAELWAALLALETVWEHVRLRVAQLDDPQLDAAAVDVLRAEAAAAVADGVASVADGVERTGDLLDRAAVQLEQADPAAAADTLERARTSLQPAGRAQQSSALLPERAATLLENCAAGLLRREQPPLQRVRALLDTADGLTRDLHLSGTIATTRQELIYQEVQQDNLAAMAPDLRFSLAKSAMQILSALPLVVPIAVWQLSEHHADAVTYGYATAVLVAVTLALAAIHYLLDWAHYQRIINDDPGSAPCRTSTR
jgi:hypothetical protein